MTALSNQERARIAANYRSLIQAEGESVMKEMGYVLESLRETGLDSQAAVYALLMTIFEAGFVTGVNTERTKLN